MAILYLHNCNYENLLKETVLKKIDWLVKEFDFLFKLKNQKYSQYDKTLANQIIACFSGSSDFTYNEELNEMLANTLKTLNELYPTLLRTA